MLSSNQRQVLLRWSGEGMVFEGGPSDGVQITVDSDGVHGQTPMQLLLGAVAGCMAIDVLMILEKSRVPVDALEVEVIGDRAETVPKRYLRMLLEYRLEGPQEEDQPKGGCVRQDHRQTAPRTRARDLPEEIDPHHVAKDHVEAVEGEVQEQRNRHGDQTGESEDLQWGKGSLRRIGTDTPQIARTRAMSSRAAPARKPEISRKPSRYAVL